MTDLITPAANLAVEQAEGQRIGEEMETEYRSLYMRAQGGDLGARHEMSHLLLGGEPTAYLGNLLRCVGLVLAVPPGRERWNEVTGKGEMVFSNPEIDEIVCWAEDLLFRQVMVPPPDKVFEVGAMLWGDSVGPSAKIFREPDMPDSDFEDRAKLVKWLGWLGFEVQPLVHPAIFLRVEVDADRLVEECDRLLMVLTAIGWKPKGAEKIWASYQPRLSLLDHFGIINIQLNDGVFPP